MSLFKDIAKIVKRIVGVEMADVHTHIPCQVVSYTAATNTCSLQPCIMRMRADDPNNFKEVQLPVLEDVPVQQMGSGSLLLSVAPQADSYGLLHVSERSIEKWTVQGGVVAPGTARKFDLSDGFFVPSVAYNVPDLLPVPVATDRISLRTKLGTTEVSVLDDETIEIKNALGSVVVDITGVVTVNNDTDAVALASRVDALVFKLDTIFRTGWTPVSGDGGAALQVAYLAPDTGFPIPPTSVASVKLKVDA